MRPLLFPYCLALAVSAALADGVLINHTMPPAQLLHLDGTPVDGVSASASPGELIDKVDTPGVVLVAIIGVLATVIGFYQWHRAGDK